MGGLGQAQRQKPTLMTPGASLSSLVPVEEWVLREDTVSCWKLFSAQVPLLRRRLADAL